MIDKIENMFVSGKRRLVNNLDVYIFSAHLERSFTERAKAGLKPVIQDFILAVNERFFLGCYWLVSAYDFDEFWQYDQSEPHQIEKHLMCKYPAITYVCTDTFHILLLLNELKAQTFSMLRNATLPNGEILLLDVFDAEFTAFYPEDIDSIVARISEIDIGIIEAADIICKQKMEIDVWYFDSCGAKIHELTIKCTPNRKNEVKDCMIDVFEVHGIQLEFIDVD